MLTLRYTGTNQFNNFTWGNLYYGYDMGSYYTVKNDRGQTFNMQKYDFTRI